MKFWELQDLQAQTFGVFECLAGVHHGDTRGEIIIEGRPVTIKTPQMPSVQVFLLQQKTERLRTGASEIHWGEYVPSIIKKIQLHVFYEASGRKKGLAGTDGGFESKSSRL